MQAKLAKTPKDNNKTEGSGKKGRATFIDEIVGSQLRQRRSLLGLSQEKLAELMGITFQQIQKYENGANRISASRLFDLSKVLDIPVGFFFETAQDNKGDDIVYGFSDNEQATFDGPDNVMNQKETIDLIRVYYSIQDEKLRKDLFKLVKSMAENFKKQQT